MKKNIILDINSYSIISVLSAAQILADSMVVKILNSNQVLEVEIISNNAKYNIDELEGKFIDILTQEELRSRLRKIFVGVEENIVRKAFSPIN